VQLRVGSGFSPFEELVMIRWAPWEGVASDLATGSLRAGAKSGSRFAAPRGVVLGALWCAAAVAEALALRPVLFDSEAPIVVLDVIFTLVGGSFAACGLVAWRRRPDSRSGMLMTATGFLFFVNPLLSQLDGELANTIRVLFVDAWIFFFVALILTLLTRGRLQGRLDRLLVAVYALPLVIGQVAWMMFDPEEGYLLLAFPDADVAHAIDRCQRGLLVGACLATVVVVVARWWRAAAPRRRALLPSLAGAFALLCFATLLVNDLVTGSRSQALLWLAACSLVLVPAAFLAGLLRSRLARGNLAELFRGLGAMRGEELRAALARTLGDPQLAVGYRAPGHGGYVEADGTPLALPPPGGERAVMPIERDGSEVGALVYDAALDDDPELVEAVRAAAAIAIETEQLQIESQARLAELKASRERIVTAGDAERRRLERDLHDGAQQRLVAIALQLRLLERRVGEDPSARELVATASEELARSLAELRELARGIHPAVLEHGLASALDSLATRSTVATGVTFEPTERLPEPVELAAYFVASEALANIAKYAQAGHATIRVWRNGDAAGIEIADDGIGGADETRGSGLRGLVDRVEALDGVLSVTSPPGVGTTVTAWLPCASS
jgi:signal transduction histidine kinase